MSERSKGTMQMLICALLWSIGGLFIKLLPWNPVAIAGSRSLIAAGVIFIYIRIRRFPLVISKRTLWIAICIAGTHLSFVGATKLTTAANAIVIQYTGPLYLLIYNAVFRKQKIHIADYLVVLLTVLGIGVFFFDDLDGGTAIGNGVAMISGVFFAGMFITTGDVGETERINGIFQGQLLTALIGIPVLIATRAPITGQTILCVLALGVFQLGISYVLYSLAMRQCPPLTCSLLAALEPLLNPVWVFLFAGERPGLLSLAGGVIVISSITLWCVWNEKRARRVEMKTADG